MFSRILLGVCLLVAVAKYAESVAPFTVMIHKFYPAVPGDCFYVTCEQSVNEGELYNCTKKYMKDNTPTVYTYCGLKVSSRGDNEFDMTDGFGKPTGKTGKLIVKDDIFVFQGKDNGKVDTIICGTYKNILDEDMKKKLQKRCPRMANMVDNGKC